jgi:hypothetical protein
MSTSPCSELVLTLLEMSLKDLESHLAGQIDVGSLAFRQPTIDRISKIFCEQLQAAPRRDSQGTYPSVMRKLYGWRMSLWQAALSYLVLKNSPLGRTDGLIDYNPHLAIFVAINCYDMPVDGLNIDSLANQTESIGKLQPQFFNLTDYAPWLKAHLNII